MEDTLIIFTDHASETEDRPATRGLKDAVEQVASRASAVAVATLQENMVRFLTGLDAILNASPKEVGGLTLDEVEINVQIDGKGNIGINGIVGAEAATQGGMKFVLRKKLPANGR